MGLGDFIVMLASRKTKIVATIGPASESEANLKSCLMAGMNVARLNFSHGDHSQHLKVIKSLHKLSGELKAPVAILQDLQGPKIRVGKIKSLDIASGEEVVVVGDGESVRVGDKKVIPIDIKNLHQYVKAEDQILIEDGLLELKVKKVVKNQILCEVIHGGTVKERKGVNLPNVPFPMSSLTPKDIEDLKFGLSQDVDYIALSFVRSAKDIVELRKYIKKYGKSTRVVAKIEMADAITNLQEIIEVSDAVMVARGDLAVEVGQARLAGLQKRIIHMCNEIGRPVITATQMLESMKENPRPTRAEVTDVVNAVLDGSDALMLSAESASGKYPMASIRTMHELILEAEKEEEIYNKINLETKIHHIPEALSVSASLCALTLDATVIVCLSTTGRTARLISRFRPKAHLLAATDDVKALRSLELCWGVQTFPIKSMSMDETLMQEIEDWVVSHGLAKPGDKVVLTLGLPFQKGNKTNALRVFTVETKHKNKKPVPRPLRYQVFPF